MFIWFISVIAAVKKIEPNKPPNILLVGFQAKMTDTIKPEQTILEYIESIREKDIATLKGYAQRAHTRGETKVNRAIHSLIREKEASGSDDAFAAFVKRLQETTEKRTKAGPRCSFPMQHEVDRTSTQQDAIDNHKIRVVLRSKDPISSDTMRDVVICWEQLQKRKKYMSENRATHHAITAEMKDMLHEVSQMKTKHEKVKIINQMYEYMLNFAEHMFAFHPKYRDTMIAKHAELTKELDGSAGRPVTRDNEHNELTDIKLSINKEKMQTFIREKVITSPYFVPSSWQIALDSHPDPTCQIENGTLQEDISSYFSSYRFPGYASFAAASVWYEGIKAEGLTAKAEAI